MELHRFGLATVALLDADGPLLTGEDGALDVIGALYGTDADWVAIPVARLAPDFFELSNRQAGGFFQKLMNYQLKAAVVGDIAAHLEASKALRDFVREANRGSHIRFGDSLAEIEF